MATPLVPTPLPGEPPLEAVELAIGPALSGTFDGENIHLEWDIGFPPYSLDNRSNGSSS